MNEIVFSCPTCGVELEVPTDAAGEEVDCPDCDTVCIVPTADLGTHVTDATPSAASPYSGRNKLPSELRAQHDEPSPASDIATAATSDRDEICLICGASYLAGAPLCEVCGTPTDIDPLAFPNRQRGIFVGEILQTSLKLFASRLDALIPSIIVEASVAIALYLALFQIMLLGIRFNAGLVIAAGFTSVYCLYHALHVAHFRLMLAIARGEPFRGESLLFAPNRLSRWRQMLSMIALSTMFWVAIAFGGLLGLIPAVVFGLLAWPCGRVLVDRDVPPGVAISQAVELTVPHWPGVLSLTAFLFAVHFGIGLLAVGLGQVIASLLVLCFVLPFSSLVLTVTYLRLSDEVTAVD